MVRQKSLVEEDTNSSRRRVVVKKLKDFKDSSISSPSTDIFLRSKNSSGKEKGDKGTAASSSPVANASFLRRSPRESTLKKSSASCSSLGKSEPPENQNVPSSLKIKNSEREVKKEKDSPLRRSERIGKFSVSSSSSSKLSSKSSGSSENEKKMNVVNNEKNTSVSVMSGEHKSKRPNRSTTPLSKKRRRMDAKTYKSLMPQNPKSSDSSKALHDYNSGAVNYMDQNERKEPCLEGSPDSAEGSSSNSRELIELAQVVDEDENSACFNIKQKHVESIQSKFADNEANVPNLVGGTDKENISSNAERNIKGDASTSVVCKTNMEGLGTSKPKGLSSQDRPISGDILKEKGSIPPSLTSASRTFTIGCYTSVPSNERNIEIQATSTTDSHFSSPSTRMEKLNQCTSCSNHRRVQDMQAKDLCSCIEKRTHSCPSSPEEVHEKFTSDEHASNFMEEDVAKGDLVTEPKSQTVRAKKPSCSVASACATSLHTLMVETMVRQECSCTDIAKGHIRLTPVKDHLLGIQTDCGPSMVCAVCKKPETELSCGGKECSTCYHLSCLDPPLENTPPGVWLCIFCIKRKIEFGVYSVSEGIDSIWNVKNGQNGKHYLVKYKGLAHSHNQWVSETQLLQDAPSLLYKFNRKYQNNKVIMWKHEWTEPQRLLQKRSLMSQKQADEFFNGLGHQFTRCDCEWFVKWKGLGYEDATWELESSPFLHTTMAMALMNDYEERVHAKAAFDSSNADKALEFKTNPFHKLTLLPDGHPTGLNNECLDSLNSLREFWHRNQNTLFMDAQERVIKSILFMLSILSYACRPFLIISLPSSLSTWETELKFLAPFINFVVYNGNKDVRKMIQDLEFYEKGGRIMFQVLLSHPDAVIEDLEALECISWEALFIDDCQNCRISKHLEQLKHLSTDFRLLLLGGQLKDSAAEYLNLLSFLDSGSDSNSACTVDSPTNDPIGTLTLLKKRLSCYVAYEHKPDSMFLEYWVPVHLSNVQLEQYCATLLLKSLPLRSCSKTDLVGALPDTLILTKKCCDHPYLVDTSLQNSLTKDFPTKYVLDIGINACGKLQMLDNILQMVQNQGLRVLVLFQSIGRTRDSLGDILEDFIRQRFGDNSYERIDRGLANSKRQNAMDNFRDREKGRFIFLIDSRACLPSIKLSSIDAIIIYNSGWNPLNDIRSLQKITIESQHDEVVIFRLYSSFTVEEKSLIFAKQNIVLPNDVENLSPSVCQSLLSWGASYLFHQLDKFHQLDDPDICTEGGADKTISDVLEILTKLPACPSTNCYTVVKAPQSGPSYSRNITLIGEKEGTPLLDKDPGSFWSYLLDGRCPQWRYITEPSYSQRSCRKVPKFLESAKDFEPEYEGVKKRQKKISTSNSVNVTSCNNSVQGRTEGEGKGTEAASTVDTMLMEADLQPTKHENVLSHTSSIPDGTSDDNHHEIDLEGTQKLRNAQRSFYLLLKPELAKLCEILKFPENVKDLAQVFLEYIMNNHHISPEPEMILQALKISLCWRAASCLKHNINHKESLALAKKYLEFTCNERQVSIVYRKLKFLKKIFHQNSGSRSKCEQNSLTSNLNRTEKDGLEENPQIQLVHEQLMLPKHEEVPVPVSPANLHGDLGPSKNKLIEEEMALGVPSNFQQPETVDMDTENPASEMPITNLATNETNDTSGNATSVATEKQGVADNIEISFLGSIPSENTEQGRYRDNEEGPCLATSSANLATSEANETPTNTTIVVTEKQGVADNIEISCLGSIPSENTEQGRYRDNEEGPCLATSSANLATSEANETPTNTTIVVTEKQGVADNIEISCLGSIPTENTDQGRYTDNAEGACLATSSTQAESPSVVHTITNIGCKNGMLPNQEPCHNGNERPGNSADMENQSSGIPQENPLSDLTFYVTSQVDLTNNCVAVSVSSNNPLAAENQGRICVSGVEEPSSQIQPSSQPIAMTMQEPAVSPSVLVGQSNPSGFVPQFADQSFLPNSEIRFHGISNDLTSAYAPPGSVRFPLFPLPQLMPTQGLQPEPLKNELARIRIHQDRINKMHDDRKLQLKLECEQELEKIRKKYDMLLQDAVSEFIQKKGILETVYNKVYMNQVLADEFRIKFIENKGGASAASQGPPAMQQQPLQSSQPQFVQRSASQTTSIPIPLPDMPPSATSQNLLASVRPRAPLVASGTTVCPPSSVFTSNLVRPHFSPMLPPRANLQIASEARAPAPHLQRFRASTSTSFQSVRAHTSGAATLHHTPNAGSATIRQVAGITNTRPCVASITGTSQPVFSNTVSVSRDPSQSYTEFPFSARDSRGGTNQPNMPQLADLLPSYNRWLAANLTMASSGLPLSGVDVVVPPSSNANSSVVCLSDDE